VEQVKDSLSVADIEEIKAHDDSDVVEEPVPVESIYEEPEEEETEEETGEPHIHTEEIIKQTEEGNRSYQRIIIR
jgi:hypothetical protein